MIVQTSAYQPAASGQRVFRDLFHVDPEVLSTAFSYVFIIQYKNANSV
jgi:hypothetical protein